MTTSTEYEQKIANVKRHRDRLIKSQKALIETQGVRIQQLTDDLRDLRDRLPGQTGRWVGEIILGIYERGREGDR